MSKQEKIVCAAVRKWVGELEKVALCVYYPKEYPQRSAAVGGVGYEQGFITNKNRFVDPVGAAHIALDNDQVNEVNKLWDVFAKQKNEKDRNRMQEIIYEKTTIMLRGGLKPEDLY